MATDHPSIPTATIPTAHLASIIAAALRVVNSTVGQLPAHDLRAIIPLLRHTNTVTSHAIRQLAVANPNARGLSDAVSAGEHLDSADKEIADLSAYLDTLSTDGK